MQNMKYEHEKKCQCGNIDKIEVTQIEATFSLKSKEIWNKKCSKCGKNQAEYMTGAGPLNLDKDIFLIWGNNPDYVFFGQDEELVLAEEEYIELILDILDNHQILSKKRNVLIETLCVIIFNNNDEGSTNPALTNRVINELKKRESDLKNADDWIMDYVKEVVYPILDIELKY